MTFLLVFLGGGFGSLARYTISELSQRYIPTAMPIGTFMSNLLSCLMLVLAIQAIERSPSSSEWIRPALVIGFCGGFSTFSTFSYETVGLMKQGNLFWAAMNVLISVVVCVGLIYRLSK